MWHLRLLLATWALTLSGLARAETWAERLGYPPDARVLILYANYMGSAFEFNRPGQELLEKGLVQSAGLMVPCPWFEEFASWCRQHPDHDIGICLTLNSPGTAYRWRPLGGSPASSLVDSDGYLWRTELQFALSADTEQVAEEIDRQIQHARAAGVRPGHLSPFMGALLTRPDLLRLYLDVAQRHWIPAVMVELTEENIELFRQDGFPLSEEMIETIARYPLPKLDHLHFVPEAESYQQKREKFFQLVLGLPPGLTQIITGPADKTAAIERMTPNWQLRVWERELMFDPRVHQFLSDEGVIFTDWKQIMERFESGGPAIGPDSARSEESATPELTRPVNAADKDQVGS